MSTATDARKPKAADNSKSMTEHNLTRILSEHCFNLKVSEIEYRVVVTYTLGKVSTHLDADQHRQVTALILKHLPTHKLTSSSKCNTKDTSSRTLYLDRIDAPQRVGKTMSFVKPAPPEQAANEYITANLRVCAAAVLTRPSAGPFKRDDPLAEIDRLLGHHSSPTKARRLIQQACLVFVASGGNHG